MPAKMTFSGLMKRRPPPPSPMRPARGIVPRLIGLEKAHDEATKVLPKDTYEVQPLNYEDRNVYAYRVRAIAGPHVGITVRILHEIHEDYMNRNRLEEFVARALQDEKDMRDQDRIDAAAKAREEERHLQDVQQLERLQRDAHNAEWSTTDAATQEEFRAAWSRYHNQLQAMYERGVLVAKGSGK